MTIVISFADIFDGILAADGMAAALKSTDETISVINDDHEPALKYLIKNATAIVAAEIGEAVTDYTITDTAISFELVDNVSSQNIAQQQMMTAIIWHSLHLALMGNDSARAKECATNAANATAQLRAHTAICPAHRPSSY